MRINWIDLARSEFQKTPLSLTDKTDETPIMSVSSVPHIGKSINFTQSKRSSVSFDSTSSEYWQDYFNERAGILQHDGKMSKEEAERAAFESCIVEWLNKNPFAHTDINTCPQCDGVIDMRFNNFIAVLTGNGCHIWLHNKCHTPWFARRRQEAIEALTATGLPIIPQNG